MATFRILVLGAYGQFGRRIAAALSDTPDFELVLAGRDRAAAEQLATQLRQQGARATLTALAVDAGSPELSQRLHPLALHLLIHCAGPFQQCDYRVAQAALYCGAHYIDLADARDFVLGIDQLDLQARVARRWVISGASSVPALTAAVIEAQADRFAELRRVEAAISPGNRSGRGLATTRAILGYVGRPYPALIDGRWQPVYGWQSLRRLRIDGLGSRWLARCEVPDLGVLPQRYPSLRHCDFRAGLELRRMHWGLWLLSWAVRLRLLRDLPRYAPMLLRISELWLDSGSDTGLMQVALSGRGRDGRPLRLNWQLRAERGSGPQIPATAAVVLARKLARGALPGAGARACVDLFSLEEFMHELRDLPIQARTVEAP